MTRKPRNRTPDPRHAEAKALLVTYWKRENPTLDMPWGAADAGALGQFLKANPALSMVTLAKCLLYRLISEDHAPAERIYIWIGGVLRYAAAPLDRYRRPKRLASEATVGMTQDEIPFGILNPEPAPEETLAEMWGPEVVERVRAKHATGIAPLADWERNLLREVGAL